MAEEIAAGAIDAIGTAAEINLVEIELEDLFLREFPFQRHRQNRFAQFAVDRAIVVEEYIARQLLSDGGGTADPLRITSYNVCYTKLLRVRRLRGVVGRSGAAHSSCPRPSTNFRNNFV